MSSTAAGYPKVQFVNGQPQRPVRLDDSSTDGAVGPIGPATRGPRATTVTTCNAVIAQNCRRLAVLQASDEELIAEIERRGYRVHCPEVPCPECGTMRSVLPRETEHVVTCGFCGENITGRRE